MQPVFLNYSQAELDDCYDQRVWAKDAAGAIARLGSASLTARDATAHVADIAYGPGSDERLDWFRTTRADAPIHVHIHGGAWRNLAKEDASFAAPAFVAAGIHHVVPHFSKLPGARLPDVVEQVATALGWVYRNAHRHRGDPGRILLSGHSSGAHVAAVLLTLDWAARGLPADLVTAALCVGGLYDLGPVMLSARRDYVTLSEAEVAALSPARHVAAIRCPVTLVHGGRESPEFQRQTAEFAARLAQTGKLAGSIAMPDADHFEINEAFAVPASPVHRAALDAVAAMGDGRTASSAA